jgi:hypothetical protein
LLSKKFMAPVVIIASVFFVVFLYSLFETHVLTDGHAPYSELEELEAKTIIVEAVNSRYRGGRFNTIEVSFSGPVLRVYIHDSDACSDGASIQSIESVVDLSVFTEKKAVTNSLRYRDEPVIFVRFTEWRDRNRALSAKHSANITEARAEVGWGQEAAILATERFLQEHPFETLSSYEIIGYCPSGSGIGFDTDVMTFQITDPQKLLDAFSVISAN